MAEDEDTGLIVLDRSGEELVSLGADVMLFLAVLLLAYGALQVTAIADAEQEQLQLERQRVTAQQVVDPFVRCDWMIDGREIRVRAGNAGTQSVLLAGVVVTARDAGGAGYVDTANLSTTVLIAPGALETVYLDRARFDGETVRDVSLDIVAAAGALQDRSRVRESVRCAEATDSFLRLP